MSKLKSRKLFGFIVWIVLMAGICFFAADSIEAAIPWFGMITMVYILGQSAIDFIKAWKGTGE